MTLTELSSILREMYKNAPRGEQVTMIHLFGIRYADEILSSGYSPKEIILAAEITPNHTNQLYGGIRLARYVKERST